MNYFSIICFVWAAIGIISRIIMGVMGERWKEWELNSAYKEEKPKIITVIGIIGYLLVALTWVMVFVQNVRYSWIIAALTTLTIIKISTILFSYSAFRDFAAKTLHDKKKMGYLNIGVIIFSMALILMGILIY